MAPEQPTDGGATAHRRLVEIPEPEYTPRTVVVTCAGCQGHGRVRMSVHDVLTESIALIADNPDPVIVKFYDRLFSRDPVLAGLFPKDLLTAEAHDKTSAGAQQRDKLVEALVKVATLYGAGQREEAELDTILRQAGRSHAAFQWADGHIGPPTADHYAEVWQALAGTLHEVAGNAWRPEYDTAWAEAYDHAEVEMRHAAIHEGRSMKVPRMPRRAREA